MNLYATTHEGVCDRLANALFGYEISRLTNRKFIIHWQISRKCFCRIEKIFKTNSKVVVELPTSCSIINANSSVNFNGVLQRAANDHAENVVLAGYFGHDYSKVDELFSPSEMVKNEVLKIKNKDFGDKMVGVHVRRTDKVWRFRPASIECYLSEAKKQAELLNAKVFLSTDECNVIDIFKRELKDKVIISTTNLQRLDNESGIIDAVVSLYLLRECDIIVGTDFSGYSIMAGWNKKYINIPCCDSRSIDWYGNKILTRLQPKKEVNV